LLFYTDGLTDARGRDGVRLTLEAISELIEREASAGQTAPETLRRVRQALIARSASAVAVGGECDICRNVAR
jgi:serine phosphatase RsbU (regulator of sigma subunit)